MKSTDGGRRGRKSPTASRQIRCPRYRGEPVESLNVCAIGKSSWTGVFLSSEDGGNTWQASGKELEGGAAGKYSNKIDLDESSGNPTMDMLCGRKISAPERSDQYRHHPLNPSEIFLSANWRPSLSTDGGNIWTERAMARISPASPTSASTKARCMPHHG